MTMTTPTRYERLSKLLKGTKEGGRLKEEYERFVKGAKDVGYPHSGVSATDCAFNVKTMDEKSDSLVVSSLLGSAFSFKDSDYGEGYWHGIALQYATAESEAKEKEAKARIDAEASK